MLRLSLVLAILLGLASSAFGQPLPGEAALERKIADLEAQVAANPRDVGSWHDLATRLREARRWQDAIDAEARALTVHPKYAVALHGRGLARMELRDYATARADFTAAIALWEARGGVEWFTTMEEAREEHIDSYRQRGVAFAHEGRLPNAVADLDVALRLRRDDPRLLVERAHLLEKGGHTADAVAGFRRAGLIYAERLAAGPAGECLSRLLALGAHAEAGEIARRLAPRPSGTDLP